MQSGFKARLLTIPLAMGIALGASSLVEAVAVRCPGTTAELFDPSTWGNAFDREFTVATASPASCTAHGNNQFNDTSLVASGWSMIDQTGNSAGSINGALGVSGLHSDSGRFSISNAVWNAYSSVLFILQGGGWGFFGLASNPDWVAFSLAEGTSGGKWWVSTDDISKISLYGRAPRVPEPATLALFALGLLGIVWSRRRSAAL